MKKKFIKPLCIVLLIPIIMISWVFYSFVPTSFEPDISYGKELSKLYQSQNIKIQFLVYDVGDSAYDSAALIDNVEFG